MAQKYRKSKDGSKRPYLAQRVLTPFGSAQWPFLNNPQRVHDPDGLYKVDIVLDPSPEFEAFKAELEALVAAHRAEFGIPPSVPHKIPVKDHVDKDGRPTGKVVIATKLPAVVERDGTKIDQRPVIVDHKKNPMVPTPKVGAGTTLRVACDAITRVVTGVLYLTLNMRIVQITRLIEWGGDAQPEVYGIDAVDIGDIDPASELGDGPGPVGF